MSIDTLKFMSIGSNCADIWFLGNQRIRGPIDNIVIKTAEGIKKLLNGTFMSTIYSEVPQISPKNFDKNDDLKYILEYKDFKLVHNNPNTAKFQAEFKTRLSNLANFVLKIKEPTNWLVFNLNQYFVSKDHEPTEELKKLILLLKTEKLFNKTIFVQLKTTDDQLNNKWNAYVTDPSIFNLYVTIYDVTNDKKANAQFIKALSKLNLGD